LLIAGKDGVCDCMSVCVSVCYDGTTGNGILQSHAHVSAGCLCSFSLIKPGSRGARMPLTGLVFHKQIE